MQTGLHCKVECNTEIRRFLFTGTEFSSLYEQVKTLFSIQKEFVLKYKDEEGDMITISTTEELTLAVGLLSLQTFRLVVSIAEVTTGVVEMKACKKGGRKCCGDDMDAKKRKIQACLEKLQAMPPTEAKDEWRQKKMERLQMKIACTESMKTACPNVVEGSDNSDRCAKRKEEKKERISAKIEELSGVPPNEGNVELRKKKIEHLKAKLACLEGGKRCGRKEWSPEQREKVKALREKMFTLRELIRKKKTEYRWAPEGSKDAIDNQIKEYTGQMMDLKQQMLEFKNVL